MIFTNRYCTTLVCEEQFYTATTQTSDRVMSVLTKLRRAIDSESGLLLTVFFATLFAAGLSISDGKIVTLVFFGVTSTGTIIIVARNLFAASKTVQKQ